MIRLEDITKTYPMGKRELTVLHGISFHIQRGDMVAIMGPSGSGKSTLLNILGCLDRPTSGRYTFNGRDVGEISYADRTKLRQTEIGFVFQFFHLLPRLTAQGNVELPMLFAGVVSS